MSCKACARRRAGLGGRCLGCSSLVRQTDAGSPRRPPATPEQLAGVVVKVCPPDPRIAGPELFRSRIECVGWFDLYVNDGTGRAAGCRSAGGDP